MHTFKRNLRRRRRSAPWCTLCGREIAPGERGWYCNGTSVGEECFDLYARRELAPYAVVFGEEEEDET